MKYLGLPLGAPYKSTSIWRQHCRKNGKAIGWLEEALFVKGNQPSHDSGSQQPCSFYHSQIQALDLP
jgi:hypothetical protein